MDEIKTLTDEVRGPVLTPGDPGYDDERAGFQRSIDHRPGVVVGALDAADVQAAVRFATAAGRPVAVQATGHGQVAAAGEDAVLISTRRMTGVRVDPDRRTAWIEAGVVWKPVIEQAAPHGLAPVSGSFPDVGAVSYTLGGGLGLLSRRYGYAADHVHRIEVVTPDGRLRQVRPGGPGDEPDLFWALRGGRDNFGVVTGLEVGLVPVARLYGGGLYFATEHIGAVLDAYRQWTGTVPDEMGSSVGLVPFPDLPMVPEPLRGRHVAHVRIAYAGDAEAGERLVAPLRDVGPRLIDRVGDMPYTESGSIHAEPAQPHPYFGSSLLLRRLDADAVRAVLDRVGPGAEVPTVVQLRHLGGALARPPAVPGPVRHRDAEFLLSVLGIVDDTTLAATRRLHEQLAQELAPVTAGSSLNYLYGRAATPDRVRAAYEPEDHRRLAELKAVYDPANTFRLNHNIPPATV